MFLSATSSGLAGKMPTGRYVHSSDVVQVATMYNAERNMRTVRRVSCMSLQMQTKCGSYYLHAHRTCRSLTDSRRYGVVSVTRGVWLQMRSRRSWIELMKKAFDIYVRWPHVNDGRVSSYVNVLYCSNAGCCFGSVIEGLRRLEAMMSLIYWGRSRSVEIVSR